jgi:hypothetical protein
VDFRYGSDLLCFAIPLGPAGKATCDLPDGINIGATPLRASYGGDSSYHSSISPVHLHGTQPAGTRTAVSASPVAVAMGAQVLLTATVETTVATTAGTHPLLGKVQFAIDGQKLSPQAQLKNGQATLTINATLTRGPHQVRAFYVSNPYYVASSSAAMMLYVR